MPAHGGLNGVVRRAGALHIHDDRWYSAQLISAEGSDLGTRCDFGTSHLPDDLNRINFVMCDLIAKRAATFERDLDTMRSPWSHGYVDKCLNFAATRRLA